MKSYTIRKDEHAPTWWGEFTERNAKDERITFAIHENLGFKKPNWYCAEVWVYNNKGECYGDYNPCVKPAGDGSRRWVINPDWLLEPTAENREKLIAEIERRAFEYGKEDEQ